MTDKKDELRGTLTDRSGAPPAGLSLERELEAQRELREKFEAQRELREKFEAQQKHSEKLEALQKSSLPVVVRYFETADSVVIAIVVKMHEDRSVNLHVFPDGPRSVYMQNIPRGNSPGCWSPL